jgi:hypothetical protein
MDHVFGLAFALSLFKQNPAADKHQRAPYEKAHIEIQPIRGIDAFIDVMKAQQVVIDDALDQVEGTETDQQRPHEQLARPIQVLPLRRAPEDVEARDNE